MRLSPITSRSCLPIWTMADEPAPTLGALLREVRAALTAAGKADAALEARLLVEHFTGTSRTVAVLDPQRLVARDEAVLVRAGLARRLSGEPVHRIIGQREFYGLTLKLSAQTLEPRPDTEALVDLALPFVRRAADRHGRVRILDLGTGTGAIALALLANEPRATAVGADISGDALATACINADMTGNKDRFLPVQSDWFGAVEGQFHIIVSNPPYIPSKDIAALDREVRDHDPLAALDGGPEGLEPYRRIAPGADRHLHSDGIVAVEVGFDQPGLVEAIFLDQGFKLVAHADDLGGHRRALAFAAGRP